MMKMPRGEPVLVNIAAIKHADDKEKLVLLGARMRFLTEREKEGTRESCIIHNSFPANLLHENTPERAIAELAEKTSLHPRSIIQR